MPEHAEGQIGVLETEKDAGKGPEGVVKFWLMELHSADKIEEDFRHDGNDIWDRYEAEAVRITRHATGLYENIGLVSHNILYSNVETMRPALYDSTPVPDIRRRFRDRDPLGKEVSELLERAARHQIEINDMDGVMEEVILDKLLPGRGLARLNYEPTFQTIPEQQTPFDPQTFNGETGEEEFETEPEREVIIDERVSITYVPWRNFRVSPARTWADVRWVCFDWYLTKSQLNKMFPGKDVPLDAQTEESWHEDQEFEKVPSVFKRAYVREIWDKKKRQVIFIAPSFKEGPLRIDEDPLNLQEFFPIPKPLYGIKSTKSLVPVPEFKQYASQALELDMITKRIQGLIKALRLRGAYDATLTEIDNMMGLKDNEYIPISNANAWRDAGGLEKAFWTMPILDAAKVLAQLYQQRDQIKDTIFEITGLSDIIRGVSDPNETLGAQNIKTQFGSLRINRRQREVQIFARDIIRIMVEIIAEHFQPETLEKITQKRVTPEMLQVMKSDQLRSYRIDIETDSTIARQIQDEEENFTKLLTGISQFVMGIAPLVVQGFFPIEVAVSLLQSGIRRFKMGRSVEDAFENIDIEQAKQSIAQQNQGGQNDPDAESKKADMQLKVQEVEKKLQLVAQNADATLKLNTQKAQADLNLQDKKISGQLQLEREKAGATLQLDRDKATSGAEMVERKNKSDLDFRRDTELGVPREEFMAEIEGKLAQVIQAIVQSSTAQHEALTQVVGQMTEAVKELSKPKVLVKKNGKVVGSKTVDTI